VATTVHAAQIVSGLPRDPTDLPLALIVTPDEVIEVAAPPPAPPPGSTGRGSATRIWTRCRCSGSWLRPGVAAEHSPGSWLRTGYRPLVGRMSPLA
jgi:hypothetical protein